MQDTINDDKFSPIAVDTFNESCLRFWADRGNIKVLGEFGEIDEARACASKCDISGLGHRYAFVDEEAEFMLVTKDNSGT